MTSQLETLIKSEIRRANGDVGNGLTSQVMPALLRRLEADGNFLTPEQQKGLRAIPATIEAMAKGEAGRFYLSSLPMGMGKSTAVAETVKAMLADPDYSDVGVLILINQLNLIEPLIERMGLDLDRFDPRFAVRVQKRHELNRLGLGDEQGAQTLAPVLISTQQKFVKLADQPWRRDFEQSQMYFYGNKRREVVIWDEASSPIHPITLSVSQITEFAGKLYEQGRVGSAEMLLEWVKDLTSSQAQTSIVPEWFWANDCLSQDWSDMPDKANLPEWATVEWALHKLQGQWVSVFRDERNGNVVVSYHETLPANFAPVLILDAFGNDRLFYQMWAHHRSNLDFLTPAPKTYRNLTIHWDKIAAGKEAHRTPEKREKIIEAGVEAHFETDAPMLYIKHKMEKLAYDIEAPIAHGVRAKGGDVKRDAFLTWGLHTGTNDYLGRRHIFVGGLWRKPMPVYQALYRGVANMGASSQLNNEALAELALTEVAHDLQQAVGRIAIRQNVGGDCPEDCHLWITSSDLGNMPFTKEHFGQTFPGAKIVEWSPHTQTLEKGGKRKTDNRAKLFEALLAREGDWLRYDSFEPNFSGQMVRRYLKDDETFLAYLEGQGVELDWRTEKNPKGGPVSLFRIVLSTLDVVEETDMARAARGSRPIRQAA